MLSLWLSWFPISALVYCWDIRHDIRNYTSHWLKPGAKWWHSCWVSSEQIETFWMALYFLRMWHIVFCSELRCPIAVLPLIASIHNMQAGLLIRLPCVSSPVDVSFCPLNIFLLSTCLHFIREGLGCTVCSDSCSNSHTRFQWADVFTGASHAYFPQREMLSAPGLSWS